MSDDDALQVALRLKALADPARVKLMSFLFSSSAGEENSCELAAVLGLTESTVSHHLSQLRRAGLVESDRRGMNVYHRPHRDAVAPCALSSTPTAAPNRHLDSCVLNYGRPLVPNAETGRTVLADCLTGLGINEPVINLVGHYPSPSVLVDVST